MHDDSDDLYADDGDFFETDDPFVQDGPDLFGTEPEGLILPTEPNPVDDPEVEVEYAETSDIPVDPDDPEADWRPEPSVYDEPDVEAIQRPDSPLALYRRYRPDTFAEVIGQEHVTEPLQRALLNNKVNHAYLFSGPRGCGKTTSARILARCLNCADGPTPTPCGICRSCRDLARGGPGSIDVIEMDAASHGSVDDARSLRERAFFTPVHSRYKIYIIDEAHAVTPQGFNALLKLVEEPPPHVKFIFATTEPEKVLGTIRSRTHHYPFRLVPPKTLQGYLAELCEAEGVPVESGVLPLVVRAGAGSVRDALSVLDQLLGGAGVDGVSYQTASALLGYTPDNLLDDIVDAFAAGDSEGVFAAIDKVMEAGQDPRRFAEDLLRRLRDLIVVAAVPDALASGLVEASGDQADRLTSQAAGMGPGELTRAAEVIAKGLTHMRGTTAPRLHLELMCARVLLPGADVDERGIHARLDRLERRLAMAGSDISSSAAVMATEETSSTTTSTSSQARPARATTQPEPAAPVQLAETSPQRRRPAVQQPSSAPAPMRQTPTQRPAAPAESAATRPEPRSESQPTPTAPPNSDPSQLNVAAIRQLWPQVLDAVKSRRRVTWIALSQNAQVASFDGETLTLAFNNPGAQSSMQRPGGEETLREALLQIFGITPTIATVLNDEGPRSAPKSRPVAPRPASAREAKPAPAPEPPPEYEPDPDYDPPEPPPFTEATPLDEPPPPPPPLDDEHPDFVTLARSNIRETRIGPIEVEEIADRNDPDLDDPNLDVDDLLKTYLGAELIAEEDLTP